MEKYKNVNDIVPRIVEDYNAGTSLVNMAQTYINEGYREANGSLVSTSTISKLAVKVGGCKGRHNVQKDTTKQPFTHTVPGTPVKEEKVVVNLADKKTMKEIQEIGMFLADTLYVNGYDLGDARLAAVVSIAISAYAHSIKDKACKNRVIITNMPSKSGSLYHR